MSRDANGAPVEICPHGYRLVDLDDGTCSCSPCEDAAGNASVAALDKRRDWPTAEND